MASSLRDLIPELYPYASALVDAASSAGFNPRITSTIRTHGEQRRLYARFLAGQSALPAAPPGYSAHEYGWAFDVVFTPYSALWEGGKYWHSLGGVWGGSADPVHFEYPGFKAALQASGGPGDEDVTQDLFQSARDALNGGMDIAIQFLPGIGTVASIASMFGIHPSETVKAHPWLRLLGPPFVFY
jgi:hypothetical protein